MKPGRMLGGSSGGWFVLLPIFLLVLSQELAHSSASTRRAAEDAELLEEDDEREGAWLTGNQTNSSPSSISNSLTNPSDSTTTSTGDLSQGGSGSMDGTGGSSSTGQITSYGYSDDSDSDSLTEAGVGIKDDQLTPHTVALSDGLADSLNAQPGDVIEYTTADGTTGIGTYLDTAPESGSVLDVYSPNSSEASATGDTGLSGAVTVKDLGGGSSTLSGTALSALGESNAVAAENRLFGGG